MTTITRSKWFIVSFAVLLAANVILLSLLFRKSDKPVEKKPTAFNQMVRELGLDSTQQLIFKQRKDSFMKSMKPLWDDIRKSKYELYRQLQDVNTSDSVIRRLVDSIGIKTVLSEEKQYRHFKELRTVCTAEQQSRFDTLVPQLISRYRNRPQAKPTPR
jgi:protein CpxP